MNIVNAIYTQYVPRTAEEESEASWTSLALTALAIFGAAFAATHLFCNYMDERQRLAAREITYTLDARTMVRFDTLRSSFLAYGDAGQKVAGIALGYLGKLRWSMDPAPQYGMVGWAASDFKLLFWKSGADIPPTAFNQVQELYKKTKTEDLKEEDQLHMCCWEFCFLCLLEASVVSELQVDQLCTIVKEFRKTDPHTGLSIASALFDPNRVYESNANLQTNPPLPGDLLLYFLNGNPAPHHAAISLGGREYIQLAGGSDVPHSVSSGSLPLNWTSSHWQWQKISRIPFGEIEHNVQKFLTTHSQLLSGNTPSPSADLAKQLRDTNRSAYVVEEK